MISLGTLARILDPTSGITDVQVVVMGFTDNGLTVTFQLALFDPTIYTFTPADALVNPQIEVVEATIPIVPEDQPDFTFTDPDPVSNLGISFTDDGLPVISWTPPNSANYLDAIVRWRRSPPRNADGSLQSGDLYAGDVHSGAGRTSAVIPGLPGGPGPDGTRKFDFEVTSENRFGREGVSQYLIEQNVP